jgi:hypothetical protein
MSIGFGPSPARPKYPEHMVWSARLRDRVASASLRFMRIGYEPTLSGDASLVYSTLRRAKNLWALRCEAEEHWRILRAGWQRTDPQLCWRLSRASAPESAALNLTEFAIAVVASLQLESRL